jgi:O-antigen/teichoic acid export membrane protein
MKTLSANNLLAVHSLAYSMANFIPSAMALIVVPIFTQVIPPSEYGIAGLYLATVAGMLMCLEYSLLVRKSYVINGHSATLTQNICACILLYGMAIITITIAALLVWDMLEPLLPFGKWWFISALWIGFFQAIITLSFALWQISRQVRRYCFYKIFFSFSYTFAALYGLFVLEFGWKGMALAALFSTLITTLMTCATSAKHYALRWHTSSASLRKMALSIFHFAPYRVATALFTYAGPFLMVYALDTTQSGLYIFAFQIGTAIALGYESILSAISPHLVASDTSPLAMSIPQKRKIVFIYVLGVCAMSIAVVLAAPFVVTWIFPVAYEAAIPFIAWIALARAFHGFNRILQEMSFFYFENLKTISLVSLVASFGYVVITLLLLDAYGPMGGCMGLAAGHLLWLVSLLATRWSVRNKA